MKSKFCPLFQLSCCLLLSFQHTQAAEIAKLTNTTPLNQAGSWSTGVVPGPDDVMVWNSLYTLPSAVANLAPIGADLSIAGLKVTNVGGTRNQANTMVGFVSPASAQTLTLGANGVDMSSALQSLLIRSRVLIGANQTWNIANANTATSPSGFNNNEDFSLFADAAGVPLDFGGHTVTTSGAGQVTITSGYTLSNGTLAVGNNLFVIQGGSSRITNIADSLNLVVNSGELRLQSNSGAGGISLVSAAPITLNSGTLRFLNNSQTINQSGQVTVNGGSMLFGLGGDTEATYSGDFHADGNFIWNVYGSGSGTTFSNITGNLLGEGDITYQNIATGANGFSRMLGDNSGYSGTIDINGASGNRILRLSSDTAGSAAAGWNVAANNILQIDGVSVQLGSLSGFGTVTNSSAFSPASISVRSGDFFGTISESPDMPMSVTKVGDEMLVLGGLNAYTGATNVTGGTLISAADMFGGGPVTVADDATFGVLLVDPGTAYDTSELTLGNTGGANLLVDLGINGMPDFAPIFATDLNINGSSTIRLAGKNLELGEVPLISYSNIGGATGFGGLTLALPPRTVGTLTNNGFLISANITALDQIRWNGNLNETWDSTTLNWRTTGGNVSTTYIENASGADVVNFDDSATGSGTVDLVDDVAPTAVTFNNLTKAYTLTGSGVVTGPGNLEVKGGGTVTLANYFPYTYSGGTLVTNGTLKLGDGETDGAGTVGGAIMVSENGRVVLNQPEDHDFLNSVTGEGTLEKDGSNVVTLNSIVDLPASLVLTDGLLRIVGGGTLSSVISGPGELEAAGGNLVIQGQDENTNTGLTTVSSGSLRLSNPSGLNALGGDIRIVDTGTLAILSPNQIADNATLHVLGSSTDSLAGTTATETIANAVLNGVNAATQLIMRNEFTVTGTATVHQGILGVASSHNATVNRIVLTSPTAWVRVAGSGGPSILNVGPGGIEASAGVIEVKFNTNEQNATLNLGGDVITTGNLAFNNAGYTGGSLNVINLLGTRTFNIGAESTTTVAPDIAPGPAGGSLIKQGGGTLTLTPTSSAVADSTTVAAGSLLVNGSLGGPITVEAGGTLGGTGTLTGATTLSGTVAPAGNSIGRLTSTQAVTLAPGSSYHFQIGSWAGTTPGTDWDLLAVEGALNLTATPGSRHTIRISGSPANFEETSKSLVIATSVTQLTGFNAAAIAIDATGFGGTGTWAVQQSGNSLVLNYSPGEGGSAFDAWAADKLPAGQRAATANPDADGLPNFAEFALNSSPTSGASSGKGGVRIATVGGERALTLTIPVRANAVFSGATSLSATIDGVTYRIEAGDTLSAWNLAVSEVTGGDAAAIQASMPTVDAGWTYRTFRTPGPVSGDPEEFIRAVIVNN
jgi:autotransporter-associated beta strand protein